MIINYNDKKSRMGVFILNYGESKPFSVHLAVDDNFYEKATETSASIFSDYVGKTFSMHLAAADDFLCKNS